MQLRKKIKLLSIKNLSNCGIYSQVEDCLYIYDKARGDKQLVLFIFMNWHLIC